MRFDPVRAASMLLESGHVHVEGPFTTAERGWSCASATFAAAAATDFIGAHMPPLAVVGRFTVPPVGAPRRNFQALHVDFGLPIAPRGRIDVARFTALYVDYQRPPPTAWTRIVPLGRLLGQRKWAAAEMLVERLRRYARESGGGEGAVEGVLGRLVEAADGSPSLPPGAELDCGMEFGSVEDEGEHFAQRGLDLQSAEERVRIRPGELLLIDNLATAHGRLGRREPLELHQLCVGYRRVAVTAQATLLRRVLAAFSGLPGP